MPREYQVFVCDCTNKRSTDRGDSLTLEITPVPGPDDVNGKVEVVTQTVYHPQVISKVLICLFTYPFYPIKKISASSRSRGTSDWWEVRGWDGER